MLPVVELDLVHIHFSPIQTERKEPLNGLHVSQTHVESHLILEVTPCIMQERGFFSIIRKEDRIGFQVATVVPTV